MVTRTTKSNIIINSSDYQLLLTEIKNTIDKNDQLFRQIQKSNYPNAGNYTSDLMNYKIDTKITDLTDARNTVWDFINKKYIENTNLRGYYFDEIRKVDQHINDLNNQQQELIDLIEKKRLLTTTANEKIKQQKYIFDKKQYYLFLYKFLIVMQCFITIILLLCFMQFIPKATCLITIIIILLSILAFVGYYVFYVNIGRNAFNWYKFDFSTDVKSVSGKCLDSEGVSQDDRDKHTADIAIDNIIKENIQNNKCTKPTNTQT